jgi:hypothetical protein
MYQGILLLSAAVTIVLNAWASFSLFHSGVYTGRQKAAQCVLIWAIPLIGAIVVLFVLKDTDSARINVDPAETHLRQHGVTWGDYSGHLGDQDSGSGSHHV